MAYRFDSNQSIVSKVQRRRRETGRDTRRTRPNHNTSPGPILRLISIREGFLTALLFSKIAC
jgi:hypothetical protein